MAEELSGRLPARPELFRARMTMTAAGLFAWSHKTHIQRAGPGATVCLQHHYGGAVPQYGDRGTILKCDWKTVLVEFEHCYGSGRCAAGECRT